MDLQSLAEKHARRAGVDPVLFSRLINQESGWVPTAVSPAGAQGLTQVMPQTASNPGFGVSPLKDAADPNEQLRFGADYLKAMLDRYDGNVSKALAAYNWGAGNADSWQGDSSSLPAETKNYINAITGSGGDDSLAGGEGMDMLGMGSFSGQRPRVDLTPPTIAEGLKDGTLTAAPKDDIWANIMPNSAEGQIGWIKKLFPHLTSQGVDDRLLAIGAGLLSGNDWGSGMAAAAQNLQGVVSNEKSLKNQEAMTNADWNWREDMDQRNKDWQANQSALDRQAAMDRSKLAAERSSTYNRPFSIFGRDPKTGQEKVVAGRMMDGEYYVQDDANKWVKAGEVLSDWNVAGRGDRASVEAGAGGIPNATYVSPEGVPSFQFSREGDAKAYTYVRRAIQASNDIDTISAMVGPDAMQSLNSGLRQWASQNARSSITPALINTLLDDSGIQGSARSAMSQYLQAVLRNDTGAAYTGTEIADYASAFLPNTGDDAQTQAYKRTARVNILRDMAGRTGSAAPYLLGVIGGTYSLGNETFQFNPEQDTGVLSGGSNVTAAPDGVPQELWDAMTDAEKALWN